MSTTDSLPSEFGSELRQTNNGGVSAIQGSGLDGLHCTPVRSSSSVVRMAPNAILGIH